MPDYGARFADKAIRSVERRLRTQYKQAEIELQKKLKSFIAANKRKDAEKRKLLQQGKITQEQYQKWVKGQVFQQQQWENKVKSVQQTLYQYNQQAANIIHEKKLDVFAENYNYGAFQTEQVSSVSFDLYSTESVARLIRRNPRMLPKWNIDQQKDYRWNQKKVNNCILQGIIQGKSIDGICKSMTERLCAENENKMRMFARTAMTGAQNAGRMEMMHNAEKMGIRMRKKWHANMDSRTRDTHRHLDGQEQEVDDPFESDLGDIMYPGDPSADPANVYNCRCALTYVYPDIADLVKGEARMAYSEYEDSDGKMQRRSFLTTNQARYEEWKNEKKSEKKQKNEDITVRAWISELNMNPTMRRGIVRILGSLPVEEAQRYIDEIESIPIEISDKFPDGKDTGGTCYSTRYDKIFIHPDDEDGWSIIHESTHYKDAHTVVEEKETFYNTVRELDENGNIIKKKVPEEITSTFNSVTDWCIHHYTDEKMKEDYDTFIKAIGAENATFEEAENHYIVWMSKFTSDNQIRHQDYSHFNDIIDAVTGGQWGIRVFGGHDIGYYDNMIKVMMEVNADMETIDALQLKPLQKEFARLFPNLSNISKEGRDKIWKRSK